jgi:hypothetical protein
MDLPKTHSRNPNSAFQNWRSLRSQSTLLFEFPRILVSGNSSPCIKQEHLEGIATTIVSCHQPP